jgi:N-terminal domain of anti-restriction factor ArdC
MTMTTKSATRADVYTTITQQIVSQLEAGVRPWMKLWNAAHKAGSISRPLRNCGKPYSGINVLVLWLTAFERSYTCPIFLTFQQAKELGGFVKKGEKGTTVVYANTFEKKETDAQTGEESIERIPFLKSYTVFEACSYSSEVERGLHRLRPLPTQPHGRLQSFHGHPFLLLGGFARGVVSQLGKAGSNQLRGRRASW